VPDVGETVPPLPGFVAVVNWYCVLNAAVYVVAVGGAVTVCEIAPPFDQLLKRYCVPAVPCGDVVTSVCIDPIIHVKVCVLV
jgi:hypothetical protein